MKALDWDTPWLEFEEPDKWKQEPQAITGPYDAQQDIPEVRLCSFIFMFVFYRIRGIVSDCCYCSSSIQFGRSLN